MSLEFDLQCVPFDKSSNSDYWVHSIVEWSRNTLNQQLDSSNTISQNIRFLIDKGKFLFVFASRLKCMNVVPSRRGVGWLGQWPRHQCQLSRVTLISCPPLSTPAPPCQWMCALQCMSVLLMMYLALVEQLLMTSKCVAPTLPHPYVSFLFLCITLHLFIETNKKTWNYYNACILTVTMVSLIRNDIFTIFLKEIYHTCYCRKNPGHLSYWKKPQDILSYRHWIKCPHEKKNRT